MTLPNLKIARRSEVAPFLAMDVLAQASRLAAAGRDVLHLEVGEPGEGPPRHVLEVAAEAVRNERLGYTEALGIQPLRQALAERYRRLEALTVEPERILVTVGASGAFVLAFLAAFDPGDRVIVPEPAFPAYRNVLQALGIEVVRLELGQATGFRPTPELLDAVPGPLHGLVVASPANPTGTMLSGAEIAAIAGWCRTRRVRLVSDEIYHGLSFGKPTVSALAHAPNAIVINGFSKYFCMTGWRIGWMVAPPDLVRPIERLAQNLYISAPALAQHAALAALDAGDELDRRIERYRANRDRLIDRLVPAGLDRFAPPDGAFYLYVDTSHVDRSSTALCRRLLEDTGVALTPGADFDRVRGESFVRLAFCGPGEDVDEAGRRLAAWLRAR
ncbi:MAG: aminotransferase class I/II-fold pyridoxal phosphate-dependent enzyme [Geminicoccaceae bacterium]|nr:aminotransferase class I/II-fold pyridoxal phosphate-dependent enzyme [Geminicoccaceae bacterium]